MSAIASPASEAADHETNVARFSQEQIERFYAASANAPAALQNAVFSALVNDFAHQLAAALGTLTSFHPDPEAALGAMVTTAVAVMQEQRKDRAA